MTEMKIEGLTCVSGSEHGTEPRAKRRVRAALDHLSIPGDVQCVVDRLRFPLERLAKRSGVLTMVRDVAVVGIGERFDATDELRVDVDIALCSCQHGFVEQTRTRERGGDLGRRTAMPLRECALQCGR